MGLKCKIKYRKGQAFVYDSDGQLSQLYLDALELTGNQNKALNLWATAQLDSFKLLSDFGENPSLDDVVKFYDTIESDDNLLSTSELFQVRQFMKTNNLFSLSDTYSVLQSIFKPEGILDINMVNAIGSGLYSKEEIDELDVQSISNILSKIEGHILKEDILVEPDTEGFYYKNSDFKTLLGTYEKVSPQTIDQEISERVSDFSNTEEIYSKIQELPYTDFVERFFSDDNFAAETINRLKGLKKIPVLSYFNGQLTDQNTEYYTTLRNTILNDIDSLSIEANFDYLSSIDYDVWNQNLDAIQGILRETEEQAIDANIDIIGLSNKAADYEGVMTLLESMLELIQNKTEENIIRFSDIHDQVIGVENPVVFVDSLPKQYSDLNIVKVFSQMNDDQLFINDGLLKVGENLYHKVSTTTDKNDMYEFLYKKLSDGQLGIPSQFSREIDYSDPLNKTEVLEIISEYVMTRDVGFETTMQEAVSLNQLVFEHTPLQKPDIKRDVSLIMDVKTDEEYLRKSFVSDFYNYILSEKFDDSEVYRNTLSKFKITDRDITLISEVDNIDYIEYSDELKDYIRLKKDSNMKYLVEEPLYPMMEDIMFVNMPGMIPDTKKYYSIDGKYAITAKSMDMFLRINNRTYRKVIDTQDTSVYNQIFTSLDPLYYTGNTNFSFDKKEAVQIAEKYDTFKSITYDYSKFKEQIGLSGIENKLPIDSIPVIDIATGSEQFIEEINRMTQEGRFIPNNIKASKNITLFPDKVIVSFSPGSKIDTPSKAFSVNERFFREIRENVKSKLGAYFREGFVKKVSSQSGFSTEINIPQELVDELSQMEAIASIDAFDISEEITSTVGSEIERGVDNSILEDIGYDLSAIQIEEENMNQDLQDVSSSFNSRIELLNLYEPEQGQFILNQINKCG